MASPLVRTGTTAFRSRPSRAAFFSYTPVAAGLRVFVKLSFAAALALAVVRRAGRAGIERWRVAGRKTIAKLVVNLLFFVLWFSIRAQVVRFHVLFLEMILFGNVSFDCEVPGD
jgi:hypothetical protein